MLNKILRHTPHRLLLLCSIACMCASQAKADIAHRYSFTADASDSVGTAHGTVVDPITIATFSGGMLDVSANTGQGSGEITDDAYVDFPNNIVTAATTGGTGGQLTVEIWASASENRNWAALFSAGTSEGGEDISDSGNTTDYIQVIPQNGASGVIRATTHSSTGTPEGLVDYTAPLSTTNTQHIVSVFDQSGGLPGTVSLYVDGALLGTEPVAENLDIGAMNDNNIWLGRSQWNDSVFAGSYDEFRIHDAALSSSEVAVSSYLGADTINTGGAISIEVDAVSGLVTISNDASEPLGLEYYSITSPGSALDDSSWTSAGAGWDQAGGSDATELVEYFLGADGEIVATNGTLSLGNAFDTSVFGSGVAGDLEFSFGLAGGGLATGVVEYVNVGSIGGDFDSDGDVDGSDFLFWQRSLGDLTSLAEWQSGYGGGGALSASTTSVPEPNSIVLCCIVLGMAASRRKR